MSALPTGPVPSVNGWIVSLVPEDAWLEGLVNAVVHQSYSMPGDHFHVTFVPPDPSRLGERDTRSPLLADADTEGSQIRTPARVSCSTAWTRSWIQGPKARRRPRSRACVQVLGRAESSPPDQQRTVAGRHDH